MLRYSFQLTCFIEQPHTVNLTNVLSNSGLALTWSAFEHDSR
jgi:hypothetical protein